MSKLERWLIASKQVEVLDGETLQHLMDMGGQTGGGWYKVHQHVLVDFDNKEQIESYITSRGYDVRPATDKTFFHPEPYEQAAEFDYHASEEYKRLAQEHWAIQNSFKKLHSKQTAVLLSDELVRIVRNNPEEIARNWLAAVSTHPTTRGYANIPEEDIVVKVTAAVTLFGRWLDGVGTDEEIAAFYDKVGRERQAQGIASHEVLSALTLLRKAIVNYAEGKGLWNRPTKIYAFLELSRRLVLFFDKAMYHAVKGSNGGPTP